MIEQQLVLIAPLARIPLCMARLFKYIVRSLHVSAMLLFPCSHDAVPSDLFPDLNHLVSSLQLEVPFFVRLILVRTLLDELCSLRRFEKLLCVLNLTTGN